MKKKPIISVIMLTYNREQLLEGMIQCILNQTFTDYEYIIVDNGSSDRSGEIAEQYARNDNRIQVIHLEKSTIGRGRNVGLSVAQGEYIAFVDDDDYCEPVYLENLYYNILTEMADMSICGAVDKAFDVRNVYGPVDALKTLLDRKYYNVAFPTKLIRRGLFENNLFNEESKYDDIYLMPKIMASAKKIVYEGTPLYDFHRHDNNNSSWTTNFALLTKGTLEEYLHVYRERTEWLTKRFPAYEADWKYYEWSFWISMVDKIERFHLIELEDIKNGLVCNLKKVGKNFYNNKKIKQFERKYWNDYIS